jgi:hypothetical protein
MPLHVVARESATATQMRELLRKYTRAYWRTPSYNYTRYLVTVLVALLYGTIYYQQGAARLFVRALALSY